MAAQQAAVAKVVFISSMAYYEKVEGFIDEEGPAARPAPN